MNIKLRTIAKGDFEKDFFKLMNFSVFGECKKAQRSIKLEATEKRRSKWKSEPNYHTAKWLSENLLAIEMKKNKSKNE